MTANSTTDGEAQQEEAVVNEDKFNGTATLSIDATSAEAARAAAEKWFRDVHGSRPTSVIVEEDDSPLVKDTDRHQWFDVMVADHSSGSLADERRYSWGGDDE